MLCHQLCYQCATNAPPICNQSAMTPPLCVINKLSLCYCYPINVVSTCYQCAINQWTIAMLWSRHMLSICYQWSINMLPICECALNALLTCNRHAINGLLLSYLRICHCSPRHILSIAIDTLLINYHCAIIYVWTRNNHCTVKLLPICH